MLIFILLLAGCKSTVVNSPTTQTIEIASVDLFNPLGPLVIPVSGIVSGQVKQEASINIKYWKTIDELTGLLANGDAQFVVLPVTTAVNLKASGIDLVLLGVHEWKVFYLITHEGDEFTDWHSLVGKTIYTPESKGQTVDTLTRYALMNEGIKPDDDVDFVYTPAQEIVALFKAGKVDYAALPEPYVSMAMANSDGKIVLDYQDYWNKVSDASNGIPIAGLFVTREFMIAHPKTCQEIVQSFSDSIKWANENPDDAITASSSVLAIPVDVIKSALDRMKFEYLPAAQVKQEVLNFLAILQATYPEGIKAIPSDDFFFSQ
jgi:NitT/TauT family transport system substrate-binding protein